MALIDDIRDVISRHGDNMLSLLVQNKTHLLDKKLFPAKDIKAGVKQINIYPDTLPAGPGADGGTFVDNAIDAPKTLFADRKLFYAAVKIPVGAASAASSQADGIHLVNQSYDRQMGALLKSLEMSMLDKTLGTVTTGDTIGAGGTTGTSGRCQVVVDDRTRFKPGAKVLWSDNGTLNANPFTVVSVTKGSGAAGTVVFACPTSLDGQTITATQDSFVVWDGQNNQNVTSLAELSGSGYVYSQSSAISGWEGVQVNASGAYSSASVLELLTEMRNHDQDPDLIICSPLVAAAHKAMFGGASFRRFDGADMNKADPYGPGVEFEINGVRAVISNSCPAGKLFAIDSSKVYLGWYLRPESLEGNEKATVSQVGYNFLIRQHFQCELMCTDRKAVGMLYGITFA